jgi:bifunctional non-homologous end joining protein LigD
VLVPLGGQCTHAESRVLGEILARSIEQEHGDIATTARMLGARGGKVYVDYLQNGHGKTIAGPFSARPVVGATCSAPLKWSEVNAKLDPKDYSIKTLPPRMKRLKDDPLSAVLTIKPDIPGALSALSARVRA